MNPPIDQTSLCRLPSKFGRLIDHSRPLKFRFEGRLYRALVGDTAATALAANGVSVLSRSFKYHRPRGILSLAASEANTLVRINGTPNIFAERHVLADGDEVLGQNYFGSLNFDRSAWLSVFGRFLRVGFYYRAFFRPRGAWRFWEPIIRRQAGIGSVDARAHHGYFDKSYLFADVTVIGGGGAGISAAITAAEAGANVVLVNQSQALGGSLAYVRFDEAGQQGERELAALIGRLATLPNLTVLNGAICEGIFADNWLAIVQGQRLLKLRAQQVVLATGALEQPAVFRGNDLPGVILGSAAQKLIRLYGVRPGQSAVVLIANDAGYGVALDLADAGVNVAALVDLRRDPFEGPLFNAAKKLQARWLAGHAIHEVHGTRRVQRVSIGRLNSDGDCEAPFERIDCDLVCMSVGYAPNLALAGHAGAKLVYDQATSMHRAMGLPQNILVVGRASQRFALRSAIDDAARVGTAAATGRSIERTSDPAAADVTYPYPIISHPQGKDFVDLDEDLTVRDLRDAIQSGFDDIQLLKRYSTIGMGPSQGRHSSVNAIRLTARARGLLEEAIGTITARPPYSGESIGVLAGRSFDPVRRTSMHHRHLERGAQMMVAGTWLRPAFYRSAAAVGPQSAVSAEVNAVRTGVGLIDVSTLGKIEIRGPDAAEFLNRMYVTGHLKQAVKRARYCVMTDASGMITDDGVACRLSEQHYFVTATTSGTEAVVRSMYFWNAQWRLDIDISNVTAAYSAVNLAGPRSRDTLAELCHDIDLSPEAFPYMAVREGNVAGVPARVLRVGFVGELGYEIHAPTGCGEHLWDAILDIGQRFGIAPIGVEAQRLLRLEKGHVIIGQDTDGLTHPLEIGMTIGSKPFFVGGAAILAHSRRGMSRKLVGFILDNDDGPIPSECHLVIDGKEIAGRVTSCARSPTLDRVIGLAYVRPAQSSIGGRFTIRVEHGELVQASVVSLPFFDPQNERQKA